MGRDMPHRRQDSMPRSPRRLRPLAREGSLADQAYQQIRDLLIQGGLAGRVVERDLASSLGMSRTPIREALHRLAVAGYLEAMPGGGYAARRASAREIVELLELQTLLEPHAAALAADRALDADIETITALAAGAINTGSLAETRFHIAVATATHSPGIGRVVSTVNRRLAATRFHESLGGNVRRQLAADHRDVTAAIRSHDSALASQRMREHLERFAQLLAASRASEAP
jgi:DNA-binding GntR family transcriptional regulator